MRYALPIALFVCLAALIAISPHVQPQRLRGRARRLAEQLRSGHGFRDGSKASWTEARNTGWPPFHYGKHAQLDEVLHGSVDGLPVRVAGYEVVTSGTRHRYGLALVVLPYAADWLEVRGERPFSAARIPEHIPDGQLELGVPEFDASWSVYAETSDAEHAARTTDLARSMLAAPTPFSWRTEGTELLLWKRDGWSDAAELLASISCVTHLLGIADSYPEAAV
jgi:hypothetical protein